MTLVIYKPVNGIAELLGYYNNDKSKVIIKDIYTDEETVVDVTEIEYL